MKVSTLKEAIMLCRDARLTPFIWGHRGLGKSQITHQTASEHRLGFIDMRLSQCEASDLRGLPLADKDNRVTRFLPPSDMPKGGLSWDQFIEKLQILPTLEKVFGQKRTAEILSKDPQIAECPEKAVELLSRANVREADRIAKLAAELTPQLDEGILFLDELNRAMDDVIQASFQLVYDRKVGPYVLPPGWSIVCAGNYNEGYITNGFNDPAFMDRFVHLDLSPGELTLEEWVMYIGQQYGEEASSVIEFASQNIKHLDGDIKGDRGFSVQPSRRSWEAVIRVEQACRSGKYSSEAKLAVIGGLIGQDLAIAYSKYNSPVKPRDLLTRGVPKLRKQLDKLTRSQKTGLTYGLVSFIKGTTDQKKLDVAMDYLRWLVETDRDVAVAFCHMMIGGKSDIKAAFIANPEVAELFKKFLDPVKEKTFADRLREDKELHNMLFKSIWGEEAAGSTSDADTSGADTANNADSQ